MLSINEDNTTKPIPLLQTRETKHKHEFQELGELLEPYYGKVIWSLFYKTGFTEYKIRKAHEIAKGRNILKINYLIGIIKKLP
jgi:hypothetical protein